MKINLIDFQEKKLLDLREQCRRAQDNYIQYNESQIIQMAAPTGAGKTIIMSVLIERILFGCKPYAAQPNAIFVWLSDSPELNEQSKQKVERVANNIRLGNCVTIKEDGFNLEVLEDGHVYFLNTQKLSVSSNLTQHKDGREYTIWETLQNTIEKKGERLFVIIDEAHRGTSKPSETTQANSIMQKFIFGSKEDGVTLQKMPIVIGMSATIKRFNDLVGEVDSNKFKPITITPDEVRDSGLLKLVIRIDYPEENETQKEMAILKCAAREWKDKCLHWKQYHEREGGELVSPIFAIQVENKGSNTVSATDLDECLKTIEEETGESFAEGQVVHAFGEPKTDIFVKGLKVRYIEPSRIEEDIRAKIVFFKESLTTGWDCPRAETMMSFRSAADSTYIAQLMGRMVRTPLHRTIDSDETLNDVHLYLPNFNAKTVQEITKALNGEGVVPKIKTGSSDEQQLNVADDKREVFKWLNSLGLKTWLVSKRKINNYLTSLVKLSILVMMKGVDKMAKEKVTDRIVEMIRQYIESLKAEGIYDEKKKEVTQFVMRESNFAYLKDKELKDASDDIIEVSEYDIDRQFDLAEEKLSGSGAGMKYRRKYTTGDYQETKIDVILFTLSEKCMDDVEEMAKDEFYKYQDLYEGPLSDMGEEVRHAYEKIIKEGDDVSHKLWRLNETITLSKSDNHEERDGHLYVGKEGTALFKLDEWEKLVLDAEMAEDGFVCWIRNEQRKPWALSIKYEDKDGTHPMYPDFIVVRKEGGVYTVSLLEPHWETTKDNYYKAKGMVEYAKANPNLSRLELIRVVDNKIWRLNFKDAQVRHQMDNVTDNEDLDRLFKKLNG